MMGTSGSEIPLHKRECQKPPQRQGCVRRINKTTAPCSTAHTHHTYSIAHTHRTAPHTHHTAPHLHHTAPHCTPPDQFACPPRIERPGKPALCFASRLHSLSWSSLLPGHHEVAHSFFCVTSKQPQCRRPGCLVWSESL